MIRLLTRWDEALDRLCEQSLFGTRIAGHVRAYGLNRAFFQVWQAGEACLLSRLDGELTLLGTPQDPNELLLFLSYIEGQTLLCGEGLALPMAEEGTVLSLETAPKIHSLDAPALPCGAREAYEVLVQCGGVVLPPDWESFYLDTSHRLRHGCGRIRGVQAGGRWAAVALTGAEIPGAAVVSGVAVLPGYRGKGLGQALVSHLVRELAVEGKRVYLLCSDRLAVFYRRIGFQDAGRFYRLAMKRAQNDFD